MKHVNVEVPFSDADIEEMVHADYDETIFEWSFTGINEAGETVVVHMEITKDDEVWISQ